MSFITPEQIDRLIETAESVSPVIRPVRDIRGKAWYFVAGHPEAVAEGLASGTLRFIKMALENGRVITVLEPVHDEEP